MPNEATSHPLAGLARRNAIADDKCLECGGELDTGWECNSCDFDARPEAMAFDHLTSEPAGPTDAVN